MNLKFFRQKHYSMLFAWIAVVIVLTTFAMSSTSKWVNNDKYWYLPAAVQIKTQEAADSIKDGIRGIDVSKWQGNINWAQVATDDVEFAFIRASIGMEIDETFIANARGANENGLKVGAYHYAKFKNHETTLAEAELFVSQLRQANITYPVVLDLEMHGGLSRNELTRYALEFMAYVRNAGYTVMFYTYETFFERYVDANALSQFPFWIANYKEQPKTVEHKIWQHTSSGSVKGISGNVDINIAYVDMSIHKPIKVDKEISDKIKVYLNEHYNAEIDVLAPLDYPVIEAGMARGLQMEIKRQLGYDVQATGIMTRKELGVLSMLSFTSTTKGNITTLLQCRLFYKGYYTNMISGQFDEHTVEAINNFQTANRLEVTGTMNLPTWLKLFPPAAE